MKMWGLEDVGIWGCAYGFTTNSLCHLQKTNISAFRITFA